LSQKVARWVGAHGLETSAKKLRKHASIMASPTENPKTKRKKFSISTKRLAESTDGLNSSPAQSAGKIWRCKALQKSSVRGTCRVHEKTGTT